MSLEFVMHAPDCMHAPFKKFIQSLVNFFAKARLFQDGRRHVGLFVRD